MRSLAKKIAPVLVMMAVTVLPGLAQQLNVGSITGTAQDTSGAVIPGAQVVAKNQATGLTQTAVSNAEGGYVIPLLPQGNYIVTVTKEGFKTFTRADVHVFAGQAITVDLKMTVGAVTQVITVSGAPPVLDTTSSTMGNSTGVRQIEELPILLQSQTTRQAISIIQTLPGVSYNLWAQCGQAWTVISRSMINGVPSGTHGYEINGIYAGPGAAEQGEERTSLIPEEVETARLVSAVDASQGFNGGVAIDVVSKSGSRDFHGSAFGYVSNQLFDARTFFLPVVPQDQRNQEGFVFGGPLKIPHLYNAKHQTFFFVALDIFRYRTLFQASSSLVHASLPTAQMRGGDFSQWLGPQIGTDQLGRPILQNEIYDPATTRPDGQGGFLRDPISCNGQLNVICSSRLSSISTSFQPGYATPNLPGLLNNWVGYPHENAIDDDELHFRVAEQVGEKHRFYFSKERPVDWFKPKVSGQNGHFYIFQGPGYLAPAISGGFIDDRDEYRYRFGWTWTARPDLLFSFRAGDNRSPHRNNGLFPGGTPGISGFGPAVGYGAKAGLKGTLDPNMPGVNFGGQGAMAGMGLSFEGANYKDQAIPVNLDLTWIKGSHEFKFGAQYVAFPFTFNSLGGGIAVPGGAGTFSFSSNETGLPAFPVTTGLAYASYLLGEVDSASVATPVNWRDFTASSAIFAQDKWRATSKLTISYGLRWELYTPMHEIQNKISTFDPSIPNPGAGNILGALSIYGTGRGRNGLIALNPYYFKAFAPKLGIAYAVNPKTVIRANAGISYEPMIVKYYQGGGQNASADGFFLRRTAASTDNGVTPAFNWNNGFPLTFPQLPVINPSLDNGGTISRWDYHDNRPAMVENFGFEIERELPHAMSIKAAYVGTMAHRIYGNYNLNDLPLVNLKYGSLLLQPASSPAAQAAGITLPYPSFTGSVAQALRPYPQYLNVTNTAADIGNSTYNALQVTWQKRFGDMIFNVNYTAQKILDNLNSGGVSIAALSVQTPEIRKTAKALGGNYNNAADTPQILNLSWDYGLPFGKGKHWGSHWNNWVDNVIGNWRFSAIQTYQSGQPFAVTDNARIQGIDSVWPLLVQGQPIRLRGCADLKPGDPTAGRVFNVNAFADPAPFTLGNTRILPNTRGCPWIDEDVRLNKAFRVREHVAFNIGAQTYNIFNRHTFRSLQGNIDLPTTFGTATQATPGRNFTLYAKIEF